MYSCSAGRVTGTLSASSSLSSLSSFLDSPFPSCVLIGYNTSGLTCGSTVAAVAFGIDPTQLEGYAQGKRLRAFWYRINDTVIEPRHFVSVS